MPDALSCRVKTVTVVVDLSDAVSPFAVGTAVEALYPEEPFRGYYSGTIVQVYPGSSTFIIDWSDGDSRHRVRPAAEVRLPGTNVNASSFANYTGTIVGICEEYLRVRR